MTKGGTRHTAASTQDVPSLTADGAECVRAPYQVDVSTGNGVECVRAPRQVAAWIADGAACVRAPLQQTGIVHSKAVATAVASSGSVTANVDHQQMMVGQLQQQVDAAMTSADPEIVEAAWGEGLRRHAPKRTQPRTTQGKCVVWLYRPLLLRSSTTNSVKRKHVLRWRQRMQVHKWLQYKHKMP